MRQWQYKGLRFIFGTAMMTFVGCAGTSKDIQTGSHSQRNSDVSVEMNESFDPFEMGDYDFDVQQVHQEEQGELDFSFMAATDTDTASLPTEALGYRVQIFASTDQEEAKTVRRDAILRFDESVYLIFANPYYKVRVGDCLSRYVAENLQIIAEKKGYPDAWIVRTKIAVKKSEKTEQP
jgi:hypothetical protein